MIRAQGAGVRREIDQLREELRADVGEVRGDVADVRRDLHAVSDRVARIEGALTVPHPAPATGEPAPA